MATLADPETPSRKYSGTLRLWVLYGVIVVYSLLQVGNPTAPPWKTLVVDSLPRSVVDVPDPRKPSKPLREQCLKIVQNVSRVDLAFVNISESHRGRHPHMGARDERGNFGYVHNETALRKNPPPFQFPAEYLRTLCANNDSTYAMLTGKVFVDVQAHQDADTTGVKRQTILCAVYTTESGHESIRRIRETWG
jgi:hypothetical protein